MPTAVGDIVHGFDLARSGTAAGNPRRGIRPVPRRDTLNGVRAAADLASWLLTSGSARRCRLDSTTSTVPSRSPDGCPGIFPTTWRCGCRTRRSTKRSTSKDVAICAASCINVYVRALRKPRRRADERRGRIRDMINISARPPEVADRAVPGHWEGDLIVGAEGKSAIGTLVERTTRFTMLLHLPDEHGALLVQEAIVAKMAQLPTILRKTLTWDQGKEMANHVAIAAAAELDIYFCDPHSPWQRGTNENTNGLLRQYFAKGTDLSLFPADYLDYVAMQLNNRPRKTLDWSTPAEALDELLSNPSKPPTVAITA
jgi:hypothetical protein